MKTSPRSKALRLAARGLLSLWILYHLAAIVLLPSGGSLESRALSRYLIPYANLLSINTSWVFFSPGPSPTLYLEYDLENGEMESLEEAPRIFPPPKVGRGFSDRYFRSLYVMRFFSIDPERMRKYFAPWLCRQHPEAAAISVHPVYEAIPGIERAWSGESFDEMAERNELERSRYSCRGEP